MSKYCTFTAEELSSALFGFPETVKEQMLLNYYYDDVDSALELAAFLSTNNLGSSKVSASPRSFKYQVNLQPKESLLFV